MFKRFLILVICGLSLTGCSAYLGAVLAVGAAVGYYYGQDKRPFHQVNQDQNISAEINTALYRQAGVNPSKIQIYCYQNQVFLQGTVASEAAAQRVIDIAKNTRGVAQVQSELRIVSPYD